MPCEECPDGHWECGEDPSELCQDPFRLYSMMAQSPGAAAMSNNPQAGGAHVIPAAPGDWTKVGEFIARFEVYYAWGHDGKPIVKIVPVTQRGIPLLPQKQAAIPQQAVSPQQHVVPQQEQQNYARRGNEHHSGFRGE
jgi:hypothetical protein